jgi:hypothetical protein
MTWKQLIDQEMLRHGEFFKDIIQGVFPGDIQKEEREYRNKYGNTKVLEYPTVTAFTIWTSRRIYFPVKYEGLFTCDSVSIVPDGKATEAFGG